MKKAVLYARVSGDDRHKEGRNLAGQLEMCREYASSKGYAIVSELAEDDKGAPGAAFELPQLNQIREMAANREFDVLIVRELDRLSRRLAKQLVVETELQRHGVVIEYVLSNFADSAEGRLQKHIRATIAEYEREKINERMVRGRRLKVRAGSVLVAKHPLYGYKEYQRNGKYYLEPYEPEAKTVRTIFEWYTAGENGRPLSLRKIARRLTEMGFPLPKNPITPNRRNKWNHTFVHDVLANTAYIGVWQYGKNNHGRKNSSDNLDTVEIPSIIDRTVFDWVQEKLLENRKNTINKTVHQALMRGRLRCAQSGQRLRVTLSKPNGKPYLYYNDILRKSKKCDCRMVRVDRVDDVIWEWVKNSLLDPLALAKGIENLQVSREQATVPLRSRLEIVESLIDDNRSKLRRLLGLYIEGMEGQETQELLLDHQKRLETTLAKLEQEHKEILSQMRTTELNQEQIHSLQDFAQQIRSALEIVDNFEHKRNIVELLEVEGILSTQDGESVVQVKSLLGKAVLRALSTATSG